MPLPLDPLSFATVVGTLLGAGLLVAALRPDWVIGAPRLVLSILLAVTVGSVAAMVRVDPLRLTLSIDPSTEPLIPTGDPGLAAYRRAVTDFGDDQVYVIAMETDDVFTTANLSALRDASDRISRLDGVRSVKSLVRVTSFHYDAAQDWIEVSPFIDDVPDDPADLAALRARALSDPLYRRTLVSEDGRAAALNVSFRKMSDGEFIARDLDGAIRAILRDVAGDGRRFHVSGRPHIKSVMYHAMTRDLAVLIPVVLGVIALVLVALAHSVRAIVLPLATVVTSVLWTFGSMALLERPLTVLTVLLAPTLFAIGGVYGVHVIGRYEEEAGSAATAAEASRATLDRMRAPVLIAGLTTMAGFAALLITDVPAVFEIGAFSVLGVASVSLIALLGIPAALVLLPLRRERRASPSAIRLGRGLDAVLDGLARWSRSHAGPVIAGWSVLVVVSLLAISRIEIDTDYLSFFDERAPVRRDFDRINELLAGAVPLFLVLEGERPGGLRDPAVLRAIESIERDVRALPEVSRTISFLDSLRVLNRAMSGDDPEQERIPESREGVTELLFMLPKSDLQRLATVDHASANVLIRTGAVGSAALRSLTTHIESVLEGAVPEGFTATVTGNAILLTRAADGVAAGQPRTVGIAALTIFVLLAVGLRSVRLGLVAMIPNVVPVLLFFGMLGLGFADLSLPTSLIGSVALGIAIDATAHYLVRYRDERGAGRSPEEAVVRCNRRVGRPVAVASSMLMLGFASVAASEFVTLREFGILTSATMGICALTDLMLLPAILVRWRL